MKWNQFIVEQGEVVKPHSPISHLNTSQGNSSLTNHKNFHLKSLEKAILNRAKVDLSSSYKKQESDSGDSDFKKMASKISFQTANFSRVRDENSFEKYSSKNIDKQSPNLGQLCETFTKDFQLFLQSFFTKHLHLRLKLAQREILQKKIFQGIQDSFSLFVRTKESIVFKGDSPIKRNTLQSQKSRVATQDNAQFEKKYSRALQFKNQKIFEKNIYNSNQQQSKQLYTISNNVPTENFKTDENAKKKFSRTGSRAKKDRSVDSSVEEIIQRSFNDSHRSSKSKLRARQALYKFNQALHQNTQA